MGCYRGFRVKVFGEWELGFGVSGFREGRSGGLDAKGFGILGFRVYCLGSIQDSELEYVR